MLDLPTEAGGDGPPPLLRGPEGKPFMLMTPMELEPLDRGGDARLPRPLGREPSSGGYFGPVHSLAPTDTGDRGALRPLTLMIEGGEVFGLAADERDRAGAAGQRRRRRRRRWCLCVGLKVRGEAQ